MDNATAIPDMVPASRVLTDLAQVINQGLSVDEVHALVVEKAVAALGATSGSVLMPGEGEGPLRVVAALGRHAPAEGDDPPESHVADWVMRHDQPVLLIGRTGPLAHLLHRDDIRDAVCVPLRYAGMPIGALSVSNSEGRGPFEQTDVDLLTAIGHLAAVALQNTRLYEETRQHQERLRAVLHRLWTAQEEERRHLSLDLHDGPAQSLFHILFLLQAARRTSEKAGLADPDLAQAESAARTTLGHVRALMAGLRPLSLDDLGLVPTLDSECAAISTRGRVRVDMRVSGTIRRLDGEVETALYRIAREALTNVEHHAESERATLQIHFAPDEVTLAVEDWGRGFDAEAARAARRAGRIGLETLRERAEALGASLDVTSVLGRGTRLVVRLHDPLPVRESPDEGLLEQDGPHARGQARRQETEN